MELSHRFDVAAPVADTWPAFLDMPRLAPCMPGAEVTEVVDDRNVKGAAKVKVGPVNLRFAGRAEMTEIDEAARSATMVAKGSDAKGRGNAEAKVRFALSETAASTTEVNVNTTLDLTGSVAQYGRASGLIDEIANQLIAEFVQNLEQELAAAPGPVDAPDQLADATPVADAPEPVAASASAEPEPAPKELSGLSVLFRALVVAFKKRFAR